MSQETETEVKRPSAKEIDALIAKYAEAQGELQSADAEKKAKSEAADQLKAKLVAMVEAFGERHTEKSKRLAGAHNTATTTTGTLVQIDDAAVDKLKAALETAEVPQLREKFFSEKITYQLVQGPEDVLRTIELPARLRTRISGLLKGCFRIATRAPSLKVEAMAAARP